MKMLSYNIQLNANVVKFRATVPAVMSGAIGDYHDGLAYQPSERALYERLPFKYRKAFMRAQKWWQRANPGGKQFPLMCELSTLRGKPMGTLFATPNWDVD